MSLLSSMVTKNQSFAYVIELSAVLGTGAVVTATGGASTMNDHNDGDEEDAGKGHGNECDGLDPDNPGNSTGLPENATQNRKPIACLGGNSGADNGGSQAQPVACTGSDQPITINGQPPDSSSDSDNNVVDADIGSNSSSANDSDTIDVDVGSNSSTRNDDDNIDVDIANTNESASDNDVLDVDIPPGHCLAAIGRRSAHDLNEETAARSTLLSPVQAMP